MLQPAGPIHEQPGIVPPVFADEYYCRIFRLCRVGRRPDLPNLL